MECPNCGKDISNKAKVCGYCGEKIQNRPGICSNCGEEVRKGARNCGYCGHHLRINIQPAPTINEVKLKTKVFTVDEQLPNPVSQEPENLISKPQPTSGAYHEKKTSRGKIPIWVWLLVIMGIGVLLLGGGYLTKGPQMVYLCGGPELIVETKGAIEFHYGYWGVLADYYDDNFNALTTMLIIDGNHYTGQRVKTPLFFRAVPCNDSSFFSQEWIENSRWIYDVAIVDGLEPGPHYIEVVYSLLESVTDGWVDNDGNLAFYGPGEFLTRSFELRVSR